MVARRLGIFHVGILQIGFPTKALLLRNACGSSGIVSINIV
jgi:hypothetical protein